MAGPRRKGTVTPLESHFSPEEVQKATKHIQDSIAVKNNELHQLRAFVDDNSNLISLVPFGKAAFFPGRLIHTNEFMVLLGEGYYADRTSKQTVEILQRRGKSLDSQVDSLQLMINNLNSFIKVADSEVEEGLVEIREEYVEDEDNDHSDEEESESDLPVEDATSSGKSTAKEMDYAAFLSMMDELEKKEELAEKNGDYSDEDEETTDDFNDSPYQRPVVNNPKNPEGSNQAIPLNHQENIADQLNFESLAVQSQVRGKIAQNVKPIDPSVKPPILPREKTSQATSASKIEAQHQTSQPSFDSRKAFTGSIVEHAESLPKTSREQSSNSQVSSSQPSKPVSRFKMQRK
ncbi:prefoldin protein [Medicago truncatula]|uniref:Prefoldin protein n=1 Tax=Medicago truncatula TaxID=3880 RepID=A0A072ULW2_MEDTR|nr:prefoldin protein [Medicago truncatula]